NCYEGNKWDAALCPDPETCAKNCVLEGANYKETYGISTTGSALRLDFVTQSQGTNVGSRVYLLDETEKAYEVFKLKNREFTLDVDVSKVPCGVNGAVYFSEMNFDGGLSTEPYNKAGAAYGTGYCDAQCAHDVKFIKGLANTINWQPNPKSADSGYGTWGACCNEMDIWEANSKATAYTPHTCSVDGYYRCDSRNGTECGDGKDRFKGVCDKNGCDYNPYRMGDKTFYGPGKTVDTNKPFTLVTQFLTSDNTDAGDLVEIKRFYVQNGKVIANAPSTFPKLTQFNSITDEFCAVKEVVFEDDNSYAKLGGMTGMGKTFDRGMVLVLSLWDDTEVNMHWLDSSYPPGATIPGTERGPCPTTGGKPEQVRAEHRDAYVLYSNIRFGEIGSTFNFNGAPLPSPTATQLPSPTTTATAVPTTTTTTVSKPPTTTTTAGPQPPRQTHYGQCGGRNYNGPTVCEAPYSCVVSNEWYSQCL
ncbi:hypothetical protein HDV05_000663, partial [Chytridiales sp. JEL 0842]